MVARLNLLFDQVFAERIRLAVREEVERQVGTRNASDKREWLSQPDAAELAGVSVSTVWNWLKAGHLTRGERGRVNAAQLRAFLAGRKPQPSTSPVDLTAARIAASLKGATK